MMILFPIFTCLFGIWYSFRFFWQGQDLISGDLGDARFNSVVLEHTWLWLKGVHPSLFDLPMFYPHANVYAYSDYLFGSAPLYWFFRAMGLESLLSFQYWLMSGLALSFFVFYYAMRRCLQFSVIFASLGAYLYSFSVLRLSHLEHAQLGSSFWVLLSAIGLYEMVKKPQSHKAIFAFVTGGALQFVTAYYYFWFWLWTLATVALYFLVQSDRRTQLIQWLRSIPRFYFASVVAVELAIVSPFLYHYLLAAKELGRRSWVTISYGLPRLQSWIALPSDHWQWPWVPFKESILSLNMIQEHYLSLGFVTWGVAFAACVYLFRKKEQRFLLMPIGLMFILTFVIGRFSLWVLMSYVFPGGSAIRAVTRIQIFMLMVWVPIILYGLKAGWKSSGLKRVWVVILSIAMISECLYTPTQVFSRSEEQKRVDHILSQVSPQCRIIAYGKTPDYKIHMDAIRAAFASGRVTMNGYSGSEPPGYQFDSWAQNLSAQADFCSITSQH